MRLDRVIAVRNSKTIYRDGDRCVKVFNGEYSKADVLNEALNQARAESLSVDVPKVLEVVTVDGKWAIVSEYIKGKTLEQLIDSCPEKKNEFIGLFASIHSKINSNETALFNSQYEKTVKKIKRLKLSFAEEEKLLKKLSEADKDFSVCHGDFALSNVIITDFGKAYIIDWSHVTYGDKRLDAAKSYLSFILKGDESGGEVYLDTYCEINRLQKEDVKGFLAVASASKLKESNESKREILETILKEKI